MTGGVGGDGQDHTNEPAIDLVALREYAETEFYDGDTDQGLKGYTQLLDAADEIERLRAALQTAEDNTARYREGWLLRGRQLNESDRLAAAAGSQALRQVSDELRTMQTMPGNVALVDADWLDRRADSLAGLAGEPGREMTTVCVHGYSPATCNDFKIVPLGAGDTEPATDPAEERLNAQIAEAIAEMMDADYPKGSVGHLGLMALGDARDALAAKSGYVEELEYAIIQRGAAIDSLHAELAAARAVPATGECGAPWDGASNLCQLPKGHDGGHRWFLGVRDDQPGGER